MAMNHYLWIIIQRYHINCDSMLPVLPLNLTLFFSFLHFTVNTMANKKVTLQRKRKSKKKLAKTLYLRRSEKTR